MEKAVFFDRDGVINKERKNYVKNINEFEIVNGIAESIKLLKEKNFLVVIITNQSAINRKLLTEKTLREIHQYFQSYLQSKGTYYDAVYYCPHLPDEKCFCRKPKPGLILQAVKDLEIDLKRSYLIGDSLKDIEAAIAAGCKGIFLNKNEKLIDIVKNLLNE